MTPNESDDRHPTLRRGLWWKLSLLAIVLVVLSAMLAHAIWRGKASADVARRVAAVRALGEPIDPKDLVDAPIPDADNLVVLIRQAAEARVRDADRELQRKKLEEDDVNAFTLPLNEGEIAIARANAEANEKALQLLAQADQRKGIAWGPFTTPLMLGTLPELSAARDLANFLRDCAAVAARDGRSGDAIEMLIDIDAVGRPMHRLPGLVGYLVGVGIRGVTSDAAVTLAPELRFDDPAARAAAQRLIALLLDDGLMLGEARVGLMNERVAVHDAMQAIVAGRMALSAIAAPAAGAGPGAGAPNGLTRYAMTPLVDAGNAAMLDYFAEAIAIAGAPTRAASKERSAKLTQLRINIANDSTMVMASVMVPALDRAFEISYRLLAERHLAATVLAIRLYAFDHGGERPASLAELVPAYLPAVPVDSIDGLPLRYDRERGIVWSVGDNGKDDGGNEAPTRGGRRLQRWGAADAVVYLDPAPRPTTSPANAEK